MAKIKTLLQFRTSVATEGAYEGSEDITSTVLNDYVNKAIPEGREIIINAWRDHFTVVSPQFTVVAGQDSYPLPGDFEHLRKVEIAIDAGATTWRRLYPVDLGDTSRHQYSTSRRYRYRLQGGSNALALHPTPGNSTDILRVWYIPYATELVNDTDSITISVDVEYELYVALALRKCRIREDLDTVALDATIANCKRRLADMADDRDAAEPFYLGDQTGGDDCDVEEW